MDEKYLIDTNIIIYHLDNKIPESQRGKIRRIFTDSFIVSTISKIEVLGWHKLTDDIKVQTENFLSHALVIYLDVPIEQKSIDLKRSYNIDTPDSIIAATALLNQFTLVTRNEDDFKKVNGLKIYNPFNH